MDLTGFKKSYFDAAAVLSRLDPAILKALSKFGAYVRTRARSSIRKRKASAPPGSPPSSHAGDLKRLLLFALDAARKAVVAGPVVFRKGEAPALLEHGGTAVRKRRSGETRAVHYRGNPFMAPAFTAELARAGGSFKNLIK